MKDEHYITGRVILRGDRILIPCPPGAEVLECLHAAHQGVNRMLANARERLFWPGIAASLFQIRTQCRGCNEITPSQARESLTKPTTPQFPFEQTVVDFCDILTFADRYTSWVEASLMKDPTAKKVCNNLQSWFCTYGAPQEQASDGGPPFQSQECQQFLKDWGIKQHLSSAHYLHNRRAELAVKTARRILLNNINSAGRLQNDHTTRALMVHCNTPAQDVGISPAMMLNGQPIKDHLPPAFRDHLPVHPHWKEIREF